MLQYRIFTIPIGSPEGEVVELNKFLRSHRIIQVEKTLTKDNGTSYYVFAVSYDDNRNTANTGRNPIDYKEVLSDEDFAVFSRLRDVRKKCAEEYGRPLYTVFTNEQLAEMVRRRVNSVSAMKEIEGIGDGKIKDYGSTFLDFLKTIHRESK